MQDIGNDNNLLHGVTLKKMLISLLGFYGWDGLATRINIRCFKFDPSINSSLKFLRRTPWARQKLEALYLYTENLRAKSKNIETDSNEKGTEE
jgi:uncharacterized protein (DUF2132 family)